MTSPDLRDLAGRAMIALSLIASLACSSVTHSSVTNSNEPSRENATVAEASNNNASMGADSNMSPDSSIDSRLIASNIAFGLKLYSEVARESAGKNIFISPASIGLVMAMTYNGAAGDTKIAMERALEIQGMNHADLNRSYSALRHALESPDSKVQLKIANSLWARQGISFNPAFIQRNKEFYGAEVSLLNFNDPSSPTKINSWVSEKTNGKIPTIVDHIDPDAILFLINAIYFKAKWASEFEKAKTKDESFTTGSNQKKQHPMMHQSGKFNYLDTKDFQAVQIPYVGDRMSLYIFLPTAGGSLARLQSQLNSTNWNSWMSEFSKTPGDIAVPRFRIEYEIELNDALKALGMGVAFDPQRANLTGIWEGEGDRAFISRVKHKSFAEVNEEGTEAAAATSTEITVTSAMRPQRSFRMIVDHPFFFAIRDNKTGTLLFTGSITDPKG